jgi:hypothetical protein
MDVEERRHEREAAKPRNWGNADAGRGHVPLAPPAPLVRDHDVNSYTPRG